MNKLLAVLLLVFTISVTSSGETGEVPKAPAIRLLISEVTPGSMSADQYCTLVFVDHRFHSEKASRHHGKDTDRKIYEGQLSEDQWHALSEILDSNQLRDLKIPPTVPPLVLLESHPYTISIARDGNYQNMEFIDSKSMKPYQSQIKPLLQWWKGLRGQRTPLSNAPANDRCSLNSSHAVFSQ
jgi:hypothetical protein